MSFHSFPKHHQGLEVEWTSGSYMFESQGLQLSLCKAHALCQNDQNDCSHFRRMPSGLITKPDLWHCDLPWLGLSQHIYTSENTMSMATTKCFMCRILIQGLALAMISSLHSSIGEKSRNGEKSLLKMMCGRKIQQ